MSSWSFLALLKRCTSLGRYWVETMAGIYSHVYLSVSFDFLTSIRSKKRPII